jgi:uncharacterized protein YdeI (YjbR/CyaY-like superfamily)
MELKHFKNLKELRQWFIKNHLKADELWVVYFKKHTEKFNFSWSDSVDQYLCFGWIDGLRRRLDEDRYIIRITPRKPNSNWSDLNLKKIDRLLKTDTMYPAGIMVYKERKKLSKKEIEERRKPIEFSIEFKDALKNNKKASHYFNSCSPSVQRLSTRFVMQAKMETTRQRRFDLLIQCCEAEKKLPHLTWKPNK